MPRKLTPKQIEWDKEWQQNYDRVWNAGQRYIGKGYELDPDFLPQKPKIRNPRSLEKLKEFKGENEYLNKVSYTSPITGEVYRGKDAKAEYQKASRIKKKREKEPGGSTDSLPISDIINDLRELFSLSMLNLANAPEYRYLKGGQRFFQPPHIERIQSLIEAHMYFDRYEDAKNYADHIRANIETINDEIFNAFYIESDPIYVQKSIETVISILTESPLTPDQAEYVDSLNDAYSYGLEEEIDEEDDIYG